MVGVRIPSKVPSGIWPVLLLGAIALGGSLGHGQAIPQALPPSDPATPYGPASPYAQPSSYAPPSSETPPSSRDTGPTPANLTPADPTPANTEQVIEVKVVGRGQIPLSKVLVHIRTRANRPFDPRLIEEDVRRLNRSGLFIKVQPKFQEVEGGRIVIFDVVERPTMNYVKYVGNQKISKKVLAKETELKEGSSLDTFAVQEARRKIEEYYRKKGFAKARVTLVEGDRPSDHGVIFLINEGPKQRILWTSFVGNSIATDARLRTQIKSKHGFLWFLNGDVDEKEIEEDINRLTAYYRSLGFFRAKIGRELNYNDSQNWLTLTFVIDEGPRYKVRDLTVAGNSKYSDEDLADRLNLKSGGFFDQAKMNADVAVIQDLYGSVGYIFANVKPDPRFLEEPGQLDVIYDITEGRRYAVGRINVDIDGEFPHTRITTVLNRMSLKPGDIIDIRELRASERRFRSSGLFEVNPQSGAIPKIVFSPPSAEELERQDAEFARRRRQPDEFRGQSPDLLPHTCYRPALPADGDSAGVDRTSAETAVELIDLRVRGRWIDNPPPDASPEQSPEPRKQPSSEHAWPPLSRQTEPMIIRGQSPATSSRLQWLPARPAQPPQAIRSPARGPATDTPGRRSVDGDLAEATRRMRISAGRTTPRRARPVVRGQYSPDGGTAFPSFPPPQPSPSSGTSRASSRFFPPSQTAPAPIGPVGTPAISGFEMGGTTSSPSYESAAASGGSGAALSAPPQLPPPNAGPASGGRFPGGGILGGGYLGDRSPLLGNPPHEDPPIYIPLDARLQETHTGRFMFSVGVNSDAGLLGSIVIDEQNFDWRRVPRGWSDIRDGTAFRGAGQRLRLEAVPGTLVQRYSVNFQEPYLLDSSISLGTSGYFYNRFFDEWQEERLGGRIALGYQLTHDLSGSLAFRGAKINISRPIAGAPRQLLDVVGDNNLYGFRAQLLHDTRDSTFLATEGHFFQMGFEEVVGTFEYPRADVDLRKYFLMHQRPDGSGRHVISVKTTAAITGDDTPIYENYYAGGFSTIRGFNFRGASPRVNNVSVGGHFSLLTSLEYMFPITADDMLRAVVFVDTAAVQPSITNWEDKYRVSPGFGLRIMIPAMGPAPIALDFAFPVVNETGDEIENFSFFVGFLR